jgi:hypothetical protein
MDQSQYSKRETDLILDGLKRHIDDTLAPITLTLGEIKAQTTKTNGRVTKLEGYKLFLVGAWAMTTFAVIPLVAYIFEGKVSDIERVQAAVAKR